MSTPSNLPPEVEVLRPQWAEMMEEICLVSVHIGRSRMKTRLSAEDLGLEAETISPGAEVIKLGQKMLLPPVPPESKFFNPRKPRRTWNDVLASIEQSARYHLSSSTIPIYWGHALYLRRFKEFDAEMQDYSRQYFEARDELVGTDAAWRSTSERMVQVYRDFARESAERQSKLGKSISPDQFFQVLWDGLQSLIPSREEIYNSFYMQMDYGFVDISEWMEVEAKQKALAEQREAIWNEIKKNPARSAEARVFEEMRQARLEIESRRLEEARNLQDEILREVKAHFSSLTYEVATGILASMNQVGGFEGRHVAAMKKLLRILTDVPFLADKDAQAMRDEVSNLFRDYASDMPSDKVAQVLRDIAIVTRSTLIQLDETPRSARELGIPDVPDINLVRRSRIALDAPVFQDLELEARKPR